MIPGCVFEASPHGRDGFGHEILCQHHQHNWAFVSHVWPIFGPPQHISGFGGVLKPHMCGVKREIGGPNRPHDAHDAAGSWGPAGRLKCAINPKKRSKCTMWAVFVAASTSEMQLWARTWSACTKNHV